MAAIEFQAWPKTPRLFRDVVITEKIDGTNSAIIVRKLDEDDEECPLNATAEVKDEGQPFDTYYAVAAQSRKRIITPGKATDNFGFATWVREHADALVKTLGEGVHYGEWWGSGIQRGYGLTDGEKRFSLFNVNRYAHVTEIPDAIPGLGVVPVLDTFTFETQRVRDALWDLEENGSKAAPGFMRPEGVVVFHSATGTVFKALIENDDQPKGDA